MAGSAHGRPRWTLAGGLAGFVAGSALQLMQPQLWPGWAYGALLAATLVLLRRAVRVRRARTVLVALLLAGLGFAATGWRATVRMADALDPSLEGRDLVLTGVVDAMPQAVAGGLRFRFAVERAEPARSGRRDGAPDPAVSRAATAVADDGSAAAPVRVPPLLWLGWWGGVSSADGGVRLDAGPPVLRAGERWRLTVRLRAPHGSRNPHGFDYELWLWERGIGATGTVRAGLRDARPQRLDDSALRPVERMRQQVREQLLRTLGGPGMVGPGSDPMALDAEDATAAPRRAAVLAALVTGDQALVDRADWALFRATGVTHLMAISGLHVTLFAWVAALAVGWLWRCSPRLMLAWPAQHAALTGGLLLALAYAVFSGWAVPAQRTVCMLAVVLLLRLAGQRWPWPMTWLAACAAVVAWDPWALTQAGFWLSFVAVGILFATNAGAIERDSKRPGARFFSLMREQAVITVALTPLVLVLFQQVSLVSLPANLIAIPVVTLLVTPLALLGVLLPPLWWLADAVLAALLWVLAQLAAWPRALLAVPAAPAWAGAAGVAGGLLLAMRLPPALRLMGMPLLLPVLLWSPPRPSPGQFELIAVDVGQGSAVILRTARHTLLYDAGPRYSRDADAGHRVLVPLLRALGERVDLLMLSHADTDHTGGALAVLAAHPQARLMGTAPRTGPTASADPALPATPCTDGQHWSWDGVRFEVLHPVVGDADRPGLRSNALSCVLRVVGTGGAALLAGDVEAAQEARLTRDHGPQGLRADLLLVPHHGSRTSSSEAFVAAVAPRLAVVQAGWRNRFGHPHPAVVQRLQAQGVRVVQTARCGAARWSSATPGRLTCERQRQPRYWQHPVGMDAAIGDGRAGGPRASGG